MANPALPPQSLPNCDFKTLVMERHAAKSFGPSRVSSRQLTELMDLIRFAPSAFNLQPWKVMIIEDSRSKSDLLEAAYNQSQIVSCSHLLVFCVNRELELLADKLEANALAVGTPRQTVDEFVHTVRQFVAGLAGATRLAWAQRQTYLALANGLNGAKSLGLDSCPMEGFDPAEFSRILKLPSSLVPTVLMPVGAANDVPRPKSRFRQEELFIGKSGAPFNVRSSL